MSQWTQLSWYVAIALIVIIMGAAAVTLWLIATGDINIKNVLEEPDSDKASLSRFQFLIFTFVVAGLFLLLSIESGTFVAVPNSVLMLLGISAGSYVVSKGITAGAKSTPAGTAAFHAANAAVHATSAAASAESAAATAARAAADSVPK
jgi:hypothetical protein